ncbi:MAG: NAD-dependent epimerase/dehydratase family protein [Polyangiales bacterium]|nr:NAD-dependent epimerase/dehydratase family protein [Myxococcales bacterium]
MRFLVLGASGFVGGAFARRARAAGDEVHALVRDPGGQAATALAREGVVLRAGHLGDPNAIRDAAEGAAVLVNAAGLVDRRASAKAAAWTHVAGTENVLNAARAAGVERVVHVSCANVTLHLGSRVNWNEERSLPKRPMGVHARTTLLGDELALGAHSSAMEVTVLRPATVWGPGDQNLLPHALRENANGGMRLPGDGDALFETVHIDSLVDAMVAASEESRAAGRLYLIADGAMESAKHFFDALLRAAGAVPGWRSGPTPWIDLVAQLALGRPDPIVTPDDVVERAFDTHFDTQRARGELLWEPGTNRSARFEALARAVHADGGHAAVLGRLRRAPSDASVEAQIEAAAAWSEAAPETAGHR